MGVSHHRSPASEGCEPFDSTWINTVWPLACIWSWPSWHAWIKILHGLTCRAMCFDINFWAPILKIFFWWLFGAIKMKILYSRAFGHRSKTTTITTSSRSCWSTLGWLSPTQRLFKQLWRRWAKSTVCWGKLLVLFLCRLGWSADSTPAFCVRNLCMQVDAAKMEIAIDSNDT